MFIGYVNKLMNMFVNLRCKLYVLYTVLLLFLLIYHLGIIGHTGHRTQTDDDDLMTAWNIGIRFFLNYTTPRTPGC